MHSPETISVIAFECEQIAEQAEALAAGPFTSVFECDLARLIASTNRNIARLIEGKEGQE